MSLRTSARIRNQVDKSVIMSLVTDFAGALFRDSGQPTLHLKAPKCCGVCVPARVRARLLARLRRHRIEAQDSRNRSGCLHHWVKCKNPAAPAATREIEEDWGKQKWR